MQFSKGIWCLGAESAQSLMLVSTYRAVAGVKVAVNSPGTGIMHL